MYRDLSVVREFSNNILYTLKCLYVTLQDWRHPYQFGIGGLTQHPPCFRAAIDSHYSPASANSNDLRLTRRTAVDVCVGTFKTWQGGYAGKRATMVFRRLTRRALFHNPFTQYKTSL